MRDSLVVAPFWSDIDTRLTGTIHYRLIEAGSSTGESDMVLLSFVSGLVAARGPESVANFSATAMLVAQWLNVPPFPHGSNSSGNPEVSPTATQFINQVDIIDIVTIVHSLQCTSKLESRLTLFVLH